MQEFDIFLKLLLQRSKSLITEVTGKMIERWLPIELPEFKNRRVDLLGQADDGTIIQLECQSTNDPYMPLRMAEYCLGVYRLYRQFPLQLVLYIGRPTLRMEDYLEGPSCFFRYRLIDLRTVESSSLLTSSETSDNALGILTRLSDEKQAVRRIVQKIAEEGNPAERLFYLEALLLLAGLRGLEEQIAEVATEMPIPDEVFLENKVLQRYLQNHFQRGLQEGRQGGERALLQRQLEKRFGALPPWALEQLGTMSKEKLDELGLRLLDAGSLEETLP